MPMIKPHLEFTRVDMNSGWVTPPGYPAGIQQKLLASDIDESGKMGSRTRLLRFAPYTTAPFVDDHWIIRDKAEIGVRAEFPFRSINTCFDVGSAQHRRV